MVSIGMCVLIGILAFVGGTLVGVALMCLCIVSGGNKDESGADCDLEEEHRPEI